MAAENRSLSLSQYMVLFGLFRSKAPELTDTQSIVGANSEFEFSRSFREMPNWAGDYPSDKLPGPLFGFHWGQTPKNGECFVFGALDPFVGGKSRCSCDFQLAKDNTSGISRKHFTIDIYPQPNVHKRVAVRLSCVAHSGVMITEVSGQNRQRRLKLGENFVISGHSEIQVPGLSFHVWLPKLNARETKARRYLAYQFHLSRSRTLPAHIPGIGEGSDTRCDQIRRIEGTLYIGKDTPPAENTVWISMEKNTPSTTTQRPFFDVWSPPNRCGSAWPPIIRPNSTTQVVQEAVNQLQTYSRLAAKLNHPNVYQFFGMGVDLHCREGGNLPWAIGERISTTTKMLSNYLGISTLSTKQKLSVFEQACSALAHAHERGVVHGHLAPHYVLVTQAEDGAVAAKVFGFLDGESQSDFEGLSYLGLRLIRDGSAEELEEREKQGPWPDRKKRLMQMAQTSAPYVRPVLVNLLHGSFTAYNAKHLLSGLLLDEDAVRSMDSGPMPTKPGNSLATVIAPQTTAAAAVPSKRVRWLSMGETPNVPTTARRQRSPESSEGQKTTKRRDCSNARSSRHPLLGPPLKSPEQQERRVEAALNSDLKRKSSSEEDIIDDANPEDFPHAKAEAHLQRGDIVPRGTSA